MLTVQCDSFSSSFNIRPTGDCRACRLSPDDKYLALIASDSKKLYVYSIENGNYTLLSSPSSIPTDPTNKICFSPDGNYLVVPQNGSGYMYAYKIENGVFTQVSVPISTNPYGKSCCFSADSKYLATTFNSYPYVTVYLVSADGFTELPYLTNSTSVNACALSPDGTYLAITSSSSIKIFKNINNTFTFLKEIDSIKDCTICSYSPDGKYLFCGYEANNSTNNLTVLLATNEAYTQVSDLLPPIYGTIKDIYFSYNGKYLCIATYRSPHVYIFKHSEGVYTLLPQQYRMSLYPSSLCISSDGNTLICAYHNVPYVEQYYTSPVDFSSHSKLKKFPNGGCRGCAFSPDGKELLTLNLKPPFRNLYAIKEEEYELKSSTEYSLQGIVSHLNSSPDGSHLVVGSKETAMCMILKVINRTFMPVLYLPFSSALNCSCYSADGNLLALGFQSIPYIALYKRVGDHYFEISTQELGIEWGVTSVSLSPDGTLLALSTSSHSYMFSISTT